MPSSGNRSVRQAASLLLAGSLFATWAGAHQVEKQVFLVVEDDAVVAPNTRFGRFDRLEMGAKEKILDYKVSSAVAVVATNRRFSAYGVLGGGWNSRRVQAEERLEAIEVEDYSATLVTSRRILNFSGRTGTWSEIRR